MALSRQFVKELLNYVIDCLADAHVHRTRSLAAIVSIVDIVGNILTDLQCIELDVLQRRKMKENVVAAGTWSDEPETFVRNQLFD